MKNKLITPLCMASLCLGLLQAKIFEQNPVTGKKEMQIVSEDKEIALGKEYPPKQIQNRNEGWELIKADDEGLDYDPKNAHIWHYKGLAYYDKDEWDLAIKAFDKALELDPKLAVAWSSKGLAHMQKQEWDLVIKALDKVIEFDPKNTRVWRCKGRVHIKQQEWDLAIKAFDKALELDPEDFFAMRGYIIALHEEGRHQLAAIYEKKLAELSK